MTKNYILTGTPGAGKTTLIRQLEVMGYPVVNEAATDVIALQQALGINEPWQHSSFINDVAKLQNQRQLDAKCKSRQVQFFDRSPLDTYACCLFLNYQPSSFLIAQLEHMQQQCFYQKQVFFIENLGECKPSSARKISFKEALQFEKLHQQVYEEWGYQCIKIESMGILERINKILAFIKP